MTDNVDVLSSPFVRREVDVASIMWQVVVALVPAIAVTVALFGFGVLIQLALATGTALGAERLVCHLRNREPTFGFADGTAVVLAMIVALSMPPYVLWWLTLLATAVASLIGKHAFGGTGNNIFNPAMVGYLFVLVCFPRLMSYWPESSVGNYFGPLDSIRLIFGFQASTPDAVSGATALEHHRTQIALMRMRSEFTDSSIYGWIAGRGWEWVSLAYLTGGLWLCWRRVISLKIPLGVIAGFSVCALVLHVHDADRYAGPLFHLFAGGFMLAAWFVATDPVSAATTPRGMLIYGLIIGVMIYAIRIGGAYPDGIAFAVILANGLVPLIDRLCTPKRYGS